MLNLYEKNDEIQQLDFRSMIHNLKDEGSSSHDRKESLFSDTQTHTRIHTYTRDNFSEKK